MFVSVVSINCYLLLLVGQPSSAFKWGYDLDNGPSKWLDYFPNGRGTRQSPINIVTEVVKVPSGVKALEPIFFDYDPSTAVSVEKKGFSVHVSFADHAANDLWGGSLYGTYRLEQLHFHWGSFASHGSEHSVDGEYYAAEMHLVHFNKEKYSNRTEALNHPDGIAVLAVFMKIGATENEELQKIIDLLPELLEASEETSVEINFQFDVTKLMPKSTECFWTYKGSLTAPPLNEAVIWHIFTEPVEISNFQLEAMRQLYSRDRRPVQPLNGRLVRGTCDF